ncbi:MAG: zinc ABC transporter solute-binding protein [Bacteroidales bacterium]|nr:zinc ABC transporter solute-binding protein [Bacteroidales bacterium]
MKKLFLLSAVIIAVSCRSGDSHRNEERIVTVSISPFAFFVEKIAGEDFRVNVMVPAGSDPHLYEPTPARVSALRNSVAYISNGYLDFEVAWMDRFLSVNRNLKLLRLADSVNLIKDEEHGHGHGIEADPHFWIAPSEALAIASSVRDLLCILNPGMKEKYERNFSQMADSISSIHRKAAEMLAPYRGSRIFVFHPTLGYLARDYGLEQVAIEKEGKEPSPSMMKEVIDNIKASGARFIFVQKEFDSRHAAEVAAETGAELVVISTLSPDWYGDVNGIIEQIYKSLVN